MPEPSEHNHSASLLLSMKEMVETMADFLNQLKYDLLVLYETLKYKNIITEKDLEMGQVIVTSKILQKMKDDKKSGPEYSTTGTPASSDSDSSSESSPN